MQILSLWQKFPRFDPRVNQIQGVPSLNHVKYINIYFSYVEGDNKRVSSDDEGKALETSLVINKIYNSSRRHTLLLSPSIYINSATLGKNKL